MGGKVWDKWVLGFEREGKFFFCGENRMVESVYCYLYTEYIVKRLINTSTQFINTTDMDNIFQPPIQ